MAGSVPPGPVAEPVDQTADRRSSDVGKVVGEGVDRQR